MLTESLTEADVINAYRYILGREPENHAVVLEKLATCHTFSALRSHFLNSFEFRSKLGSHVQLISRKKRDIDLLAEDTQYDLLIANVERVWRQLGESDPMWSVVSEPKYHGENLSDAAKHEFYESGKKTLYDILNILKTHGGGIDPENENCLEFGCGVARNMIHIAPYFRSITGVDISLAHLKLAAKEINSRSIRNVNFVKISKLDSLSKLEKYGVIFSFIALQHNPPPVINKLLESLFSLLKPGGIMIFQVPIATDGYTFNLASYMKDMKPDNGMEVHAIPIHVVFHAARSQACIVLDGKEDGYCESPGMISHTFVVKKLLS